MVKRILCLSDLHVGSMRALFPPNQEVETGPDEYTEWQLTVGQKYLWKCNQHLQANLPPIDACVVVGDGMQGHRDPWASRLCAPNFTDQETALITILKPYRQKVKRMYLTAGTQYHSQDYATAERNVAKNLNAEYRPWLTLPVYGKNIHFAHGKCGGFVYRTTFLEREVFFHVLAAEAKQIPRADVVVRAHVHFFALYQSADKTAFFNPCWQLPDEGNAVRLSSFAKQQPLLGASLITVNDEVDPWGTGAVQVQPLPYDLPRNEYHVEHPL